MKVSNPDKLIFPRAGFTKADLVGHYELVGGLMLDFLAGRPLTLERFPNGVEAKGFMQKNAAKHFAESIGRYPVPKHGGGETIYPVVEQAADLAYLANQGTVTFHMWSVTAARPNNPDWLIIDLDPEPGDTDGARVAATAVRKLLGEFDLSGFLLATGSKGFHIWVPLDGAMGFDEVSNASRAIAGIVALRHPRKLTTEFLKKNRSGRVFIDWLRNNPRATTVVPYSLRPRPTAPVAVPLRWDELRTAEPDGWTLDQLGDRLSIEPDRSPQALPLQDILSTAEATGVDLKTPHDRFGR